MSSPGVFLTIPGVVQINSWGGTTKQFNVDADLRKAGSLQCLDPAAHHRARQCQHQCRRPRDLDRSAIGQYSRRRIGRQRRRRRRHQGLQGPGHRERRLEPVERSADPGQGCRERFGRLCAAAWHRGQGPRRRCRDRDRGDGADPAYQRHHSARPGRGRKAQQRWKLAAGGQNRFLLRSQFAGRGDHAYGSAQSDFRLSVGLSSFSGYSSAICGAPSSSVRIFRSRCSLPSSSWFCRARTPTCCRSGRSTSASSSTPP